LIAAWLHDLHPVALELTSWLKIRWYGLAYVAGFIGAYLLARHVVRRGWAVIGEEKLADFITGVALFGVMVGGRLGYMLLYDRAEFFANPLTLFQLTKGGMASHGGILGIFLFTLYYARKHRVSWPGLGDLLVIGAPIGLFFGRVANFVNGELWGHETNHKFGVKFPQEFFDRVDLQAAYEGLTAQGVPLDHESLVTALHQPNSPLAALLTEQLPARHPSQLYQAGLEGLILLAILLVIRFSRKKIPTGLLTGVFFIGYAILRMIGEIFRVADPKGLNALGLSPGQLYSLPMILVGAVFIGYALRQRSQAASQ
jgi:phosphatidylglycerol---prolipoprotein diacylglyceryl transferase